MVSYKLYTTTKGGEKKLVEEAPLTRPYQFISGMGLVLDAFEAELKELNQGDKFDFVIPCEQAYGPRDEEQVGTLAREIFEVDGQFDSDRIYAGAIVPLVDAEGHQFQAQIIDVTATEVKVDFNYPLAGSDLNFVGEVVEARPATPDEVQGLMNMMNGEGGCDCGSCEGDCGDGQEGGCGGHEGCGHTH